MSLRARLGLVLIWAATLVAVAALARAQTIGVTISPFSPPLLLSGGDIGFRVDGYVGDRPAGKLVLRVNGQWVEPAVVEGVKLSPASK